MGNGKAKPFLTTVANEFDVPIDSVIWFTSDGYDHIRENIYEIPTRVDGTRYRIKYDMDADTILGYNQISE